MENLFKKAGLSYKEMKPFEFYDISDKKLYTSSYNEDTKKVEKKQILGLVYKGEFPIYELRTKSGDVILKGSPNHRIFDAAKNDYVELKDIETATLLDKALNHIDAVVVKTDKTDHIVDVSVEGNENYFSNGVLSHNTGGYALKYVASTLNRVRKIENLTEGSKIVGIHMQVRNYKNKTGIPFRECEMDLYYKGGFDSTGEFVDFLGEFAEDPRLLKYIDCRSKGYYNAKSTFGWNFHGKGSFVEAINNGDVKPEEWEAIKNAIQDIISHEIQGKEFVGNEDQILEQNLTEEKAEELSKAEIEAEEEEAKNKTTFVKEE
ncbi:MAG: hypothetical protein II304_02270 [Bacteroidales bacterium]|nr:hypothetical protein [Bacteroidales bacterium]